LQLGYAYTSGKAIDNAIVMTVAEVNSFGNILNLSSVNAKELLIGNASGNSIIGGGGADFIYGGDGDDILIGDTGSIAADGTVSTTSDHVSDLLNGGLGNDKYYVNCQDAANSAFANTSATFVKGNEIDLASKLDLIRDEDGVGTICIGAGSGNSADVTLRPNTTSFYGDFIDQSSDSSIRFGGKIVGNEIIYGDFDTSGYESNVYFKTDLGVSVPQAPSLKAGLLYASAVGGSLVPMAAAASTQEGGFLGITFASALNHVSGTALAELLDGTASRDYITASAGADTINGQDGSDVVDGGDGNDLIHGNAGNDDILAEAGDDKVFGDDGNDKIGGGAGNDVIHGGVGSDYLWDDGGNNQIFGDDGDDFLSGGIDNDILDGGTGADTMMGSYGSDTYFVDNAGDKTIDYVVTGIDTVISSVSYALVGTIDNLTFTGVMNLDGTGNAYANILTGNAATNTLIGLDGNDTLDGGAGDDTMLGGNGSDTYVVDSALDVVTDTGVATDVDTVKTSLADFTLGNDIENLTFTGSVYSTGVGNASNNVMTGGLSLNDLSGLAGNDTLIGGSLRDYLDGGTGNDTMLGGAGADKYIVDSVDDVVTETDAGIDDQVQLQNGLSWTLGANFEILAMDSWGTMASNGTGNTLDNLLMGNAGVNTLTGLAGNDQLNGRGGADVLVGGLGNDMYEFTTSVATITELANQGTDTLYSDFTVAALATNVENLVLYNPISGNINGTGNTVANVITGNDGANTLSGLAGNDQISGGLGIDRLVGGVGADKLTGGIPGTDTFAFALGDSGQTATTLDMISDFTKGALGTGDKIDYTVALTRGGSALAATTAQASVNQTTGVATFLAGHGTTLVSALTEVTARFTAATTSDGEFAFFKVGAAGSYYMLISDAVNGISANDTVIQLEGVMSVGSLNLTAGDLTLLT
jgi:trimeric autotransporter adhesin